MKSSVRKGLLPEILESLLSARKKLGHCSLVRTLIKCVLICEGPVSPIITIIVLSFLALMAAVETQSGHIMSH